MVDSILLAAGFVACMSGALVMEKHVLKPVKVLPKTYKQRPAPRSIFRDGKKWTLETT